MSLAEQLAGAIERAQADGLNTLHHEVWLAHDDGNLTDAERDDLVARIEKRRNRHERRAGARREKMFGDDYARPLDGNAKARLFAYACGLMRKSAEDKAEGRHYGKLSAKDVAVLRALLRTFHNTKSGLCFPSWGRAARPSSPT
jgi:hypothetical protein